MANLPGTIGWTEDEAVKLHRSLEDGPYIAADRARIAAVIQMAYNVGLDHARDACECERRECDAPGEEYRCNSISAHCLHMMISDGKGEPIGLSKTEPETT